MIALSIGRELSHFYCKNSNKNVGKDSMKNWIFGQKFGFCHSVLRCAMPHLTAAQNSLLWSHLVKCNRWTGNIPETENQGSVQPKISSVTVREKLQLCQRKKNHWNSSTRCEYILSHWGKKSKWGKKFILVKKTEFSG